MKDFLNAVQTVTAICLVVLSIQGLMGSDALARLELPPWPPSDVKPATAEAK